MIFLLYVIGTFIGILLSVALLTHLQRRDRIARRIARSEARLQATQNMADMWKKIKEGKK